MVIIETMITINELSNHSY